MRLYGVVVIDMDQSINRMQFLSGDLAGAKLPVRPPWALEESRFVDSCSGCGDCITACPDQLIVHGRGKLPQMNFADGGCDFCQACRDVCKPGALALPEDDAAPWLIKATVLASCLSLNAIICRSCGEACDERAIRFKLELGGIAQPLVSQDQCTGCGACFAVCPNQSIQISSIKQSCEHAA